MRLNTSFEIVDMGEEMIAVPVGKRASDVRGVLKMNTEGREVFELIESGMDEDGIVDFLVGKYENERAEIIEYVQSFISVLHEHDLLADTGS